MAYLPVKINGRGLIPRGHGLAPKNLVKADLQLIQLIMSTPGLSMEYIHPETNNLIPITRTNYMELYERFNARYPNGFVKAAPLDKPAEVPASPEVAAPVVTPAPVAEVVTPVEVPMEVPVVESNVELPVEEVKDTVEPVEEPAEVKDFSFKPIHKEESKWDKNKRR